MESFMVNLSIFNVHDTGLLIFNIGNITFLLTSHINLTFSGGG